MTTTISCRAIRGATNQHSDRRFAELLELGDFDLADALDQALEEEEAQRKIWTKRSKKKKEQPVEELVEG